MSNNIEQKDCYGLNDEFYIGNSNTQLKDLPSGRLLAIGVVIAAGGSEISQNTDTAFSDGKVGTKTYNIFNLSEKEYLEGKAGTLLVKNLENVGVVEANVTLSGLGRRIWWGDNYNSLPNGVDLLTYNGLGALLYGGHDGNSTRGYGGSSNELVFKVNVKTGEFFVNPLFRPYDGAFTPSTSGTRSQLIVKVYSK